MDTKKTRKGQKARSKEEPLLWFRVTPELRVRISAALERANADREVVSGARTALTRTGLILKAIEGYLAREKEVRAGK
jgi:hypothetical protein